MSSSLNAISSPLVLEPAPLLARSRKRTVANGDSITLVVRRCFQCSAGKSKKVTSRSQLAVSDSTALGTWADTRPRSACGLAVDARHSAYIISCSARLKTSGQLVEHVGELMTPATLLACLRPDLARRSPESQRAIAHRHHRRGHPAPFE